MIALAIVATVALCLGAISFGLLFAVYRFYARTLKSVEDLHALVAKREQTHLDTVKALTEQANAAVRSMDGRLTSVENRLQQSSISNIGRRGAFVGPEGV